MSNELFLLAGSSIAIAFIHTVSGPDHYLPFIVLSKARNWSVLKTIIITTLCGLGHVCSSILIGLIGVALGLEFVKIYSLQLLRGNLAAWFIIIFGFTYFIWGIHKAVKNNPHKHIHVHNGGVIHSHNHTHIKEHVHPHITDEFRLTPWILFIIFVFGPCEPLIPLIMYPASKGEVQSVIVVGISFGLITLITMLSVVLLSYYGLSKISVKKSAKYSHALAGFTIFITGFAIIFLGL